MLYQQKKYYSISTHNFVFKYQLVNFFRKVAHYFGPRGSGGNGWGSHSSRPVVIYSEGDEGCLEALVGKGYRVLGTEVAGSPGKIDQVHVNACMMKQLFAL